MDVSSTTILSTFDLSSEFVIRPNYSSCNTVTLSIFGDLVPDGKVGDALISVHPRDLIKDIEDDLNNSNINIVNLEAPLTKSTNKIQKEGPHLAGDPGSIVGIKELGFDIINLANNHILDMGYAGLLDTISLCNLHDIETVGGGKDLNEASKPLIVKVNGVRIGIIAVAENEFSIAQEESPGCNPTNCIINFNQIKIAKEESDLIIVMIHGGLEYVPVPRPGLVDYSRFLVNCGASAVICNHTHIPSAIEIYKDSPIIYGMGNFLFDRKDKIGSWHYGYYTKLIVSKKGVLSLHIKPFEQCKRNVGITSKDNDINNKILEIINNASIPLKSNKLLTEAWNKTCDDLVDKYILNIRSPIIFNGIGRLFRTFPFLKSKFLLRKKHAIKILNLVRCETHNEVLETVLELYIKQLK